MKGGWRAGCEAARAVGQGYVSEKAIFGATHLQSGTDLVGALAPGKISRKDRNVREVTLSL